MVALNKFVVEWSGIAGGPGTSTFYFGDDLSVPGSAVRNMFVGWAGHVPAGLTWKFPSVGMKIDAETGQPIGNWAGPGMADVVGTGVSGYAGPCGAVVHWLTGQFQNGRQVRGKTFLVPLTMDRYDAQGTLASTVVTGIQGAVGTFLVNAPNFRVWSRPFAGDAAATPPKAARVGSSYVVTGGQTADKAVVLRSRRD